MESDPSCSKALPQSHRSALLKGDLTKQMAAYGRWERGGEWRKGEVALFSERKEGVCSEGGPVSLLPSSIFHYVVTLWLRASSNTLISLHEFNCACMSASLFCCVNLSCLFFPTLRITAAASAAAAGNTVHLQVYSSFFIYLFIFHSNKVSVVLHIILWVEDVS